MAQKVVQVFEELMVAYRVRVVVDLVAQSPSEDFWEDAVRTPGQIQARVCLSQEVGHEYIVDEAAELVLWSPKDLQVLYAYIDQYLQAPVNQRVVHNRLGF